MGYRIDYKIAQEEEDLMVEKTRKEETTVIG